MSEVLVRLLLAYIDERIAEACAHADGDETLRGACSEFADLLRKDLILQARAERLWNR